MGSFTRDDAITRVWRNLRDIGEDADQQKLTNTEIGDYVDDAGRAYSIRRPREVVEDVVADGSSTTALPAGWVEEVSRIISIEFPDSSALVEPDYADAREFTLYRDPNGQSIRWLDGAPGSGQTIRITYTASRVFAALAADTTVLDLDYGPVCALATSYAAESIAAKYAATNEPILSADTVTYRFKSEEWLKIAARWRAVWEKHADAIRAPASGRANWDSTMVSGHNHLTHPRRLR